MKFLTQVVVIGLVSLGLVFSSPAAEQLDEAPRLQGVVDGLINSTINSILANLTDPIAIDFLSLNFTTEDILEGYANISNFKLYGIKDLVATKIDVNILSLSMNASIKVSEIIVSSKYDANVNLIDLIPLYGDGSIGVTIDDIEIQVGGKVSLSGGLSISNVTVSFTLGDAVFSLQGLLNNDDFSSLINEVLNDNLVKFINNYQDVISNIVSPIAGEIINYILKGNNNSTEIMELQEALAFAQDLV